MNKAQQEMYFSVITYGITWYQRWRKELDGENEPRLQQDPEMELANSSNKVADQETEEDSE